MNPVETCRQKRRFDSREEAKAAIRPGRKKYMQSYRCPVCGFFHIGHKRYDPKRLTRDANGV
jgi:rubrerythrin